MMRQRRQPSIRFLETPKPGVSAIYSWTPGNSQVHQPYTLHSYTTSVLGVGDPPRPRSVSAVSAGNSVLVVCIAVVDYYRRSYCYRSFCFSYTS